MIVETHEDILIADRRERELNNAAGYKNNNHTSYILATKHARKATLLVKNRFKWNSETNSKITKNKWIKHRESELANAMKALKVAVVAASESPNRASLQEWKCITCGRILKGAGPAGRHAKHNNHSVERIQDTR